MYVEYQGSTLLDGSYDERCTDIKQRRSMEMPNLRMCVSKIREQVILSLSLSLSLFMCQFLDMVFNTCISNSLPFDCFHVMTMYSFKNL